MKNKINPWNKSIIKYVIVLNIWMESFIIIIILFNWQSSPIKKCDLDKNGVVHVQKSKNNCFYSYVIIYVWTIL